MENSSINTDRELLAALAEGQRRSLRTTRIISVTCLLIAAIFVLLALIILPKASAVMDRLDSALEQLDSAMATLDGIGGPPSLHLPRLPP